jgi:hypothetical protein
MGLLKITSRRDPKMQRGGQKASVFARAIVMQRGGHMSCGHEVEGSLLAERNMVAALELAAGNADPIKPSLYRLHVAWLAAMGRARERNFCVRE